jgi:hypothetical protein
MLAKQKKTCQQQTNTLAYFAEVSTTKKKKSFMTLETQIGILYYLLRSFNFSSQKLGTDKLFVSHKSKFVDFPDNYEPPCQIKSKEALSALNR